MTPHVNCPTCDRSLGRVQSNGTLRAICPSCKTTYGAIFGKLARWSSKVEPLFYLGANLPSIIRRRYDFRIVTPGRSIKQLTFTMPSQVDQVPVRPGDRISVVYAARGDRLEKLMAIHNHSRSQFYRFPVAIPSPRHLLETRGTVSTAIGLGALFGGINLGLISLGALSMMFYARLVDAAQLTTPALQMSNREDVRLLSELKLVNQKAVLEHRVEELRQDIQEAQRVSKQLQSLRSKMLGVSASLYASRVSNMETVIRLLKQRAVHDQRLIDEYMQTARMIEIELEATTVAEHLADTDDFTRQIYRRLHELKNLETEQRNLLFQLEANEEVRRLSLN